MLTAVVGEGWAKSKGAIPVRGPSVAVVRVREGKAELARGVIGWVEKSYERRWRPDQAKREGSVRQERMTFRVISA
jgi:hypothetical protein